MGPGLSWLADSGTTLAAGIVPTAGFSPTTPLSDAGQVIEPSVSVPTERGDSPAATAAPEPDEEPPALRSRRYGFVVSPPTADQPLVERAERRFAHSERFVAASTTIPASRRRRTKGASSRTGGLGGEVAPAVPGNPIASMLSLMTTGTPCSAERTAPFARSASAPAAAAIASGATARTERKATA